MINIRLKKLALITAVMILLVVTDSCATLPTTLPIIPTNTVIEPTITPSPSPLPSPNPTATQPVYVRQQPCWERLPWPANDNSLQGSFVYEDFETSETKISLAKRIGSEEKTLMDFYSDMAVSQDGKNLALYDWKNNIIRVITSSSTRSFSAPVADLDLIMFLSDGQILFERAIRLLDNDPLLSENGLFYDEVFILDPVTGNLKKSLNLLPDFYLRGVFNVYPYISYSPDMKYVVYSAEDDSKVWSYLLNLQTNEILWKSDKLHIDDNISGNSRPHFIVTPLWNSVGNSFTVSMDQYSDFPNRSNLHNTTDFYTIALDGQVTRITYLDSYFNNYQVYAPAWSPDGHYLAFSLAQPPIRIDPSVQNNGSLLIYDTRENTLIDPCISFNLTSSLIWSPDSLHLLFEMQGGSTLILNISEKTIFDFKSSKPKSIFEWVDWELK